MKTILIVGATGIVGEAALMHFDAADDWNVIGLSRRTPEAISIVRFDHVPLDLTDAAACSEACRHFSKVTHVVYAAVCEKPGLVAGWHDVTNMQTNHAMLRNLFEPLANNALEFQHITLLQGAKAEYIPDRAEAWRRIEQRANLRPIELMNLLGESHHYADILLRMGADTIQRPTLLSTITLRDAGFAACADSENAVRRCIAEMQGKNLIPKRLPGP